VPDRERRQLEAIYERAMAATDLPWHREEAPELLEKAVTTRARRGAALDLGCGSGVFSVYLAQHGFEVTAIDFIKKALEFARERARQGGVRIQFVHADVLRWLPTRPFDVVLDSGCLHSLNPADRPTYRQHLLKWLEPGGDYILVHFEKRHPLDWRPIGPRRYSRPKLLAEFTPDFTEVDHRSRIHRTPFPIGPKIRVGEYWFPRSDHAPA
jgi:2-polyprenyl-3-methyl-5-hydroxy-6-metoxy-1,4-benzoquinol methylase